MNVLRLLAIFCLAGSTLLLSLTPTTLAIEPECSDVPPMNDDGNVQAIYNDARASAVSQCESSLNAVSRLVVGAYNDVVYQCNEQLGSTTCPL